MHFARLLLLGLYGLAALALLPSQTLRAAANQESAQGSKLPLYDLKIAAEEWDGLERNPRSDERHAAKFVADGKEYSVGVRYRGDWARTWPKKALKIFFEKDKEFEGNQVLNLNSCWRDTAFIREQLAYHVYAACGVPSSRARMVRLHVNGQFYGVFVDVEQPDKPFLKRSNLKGAAIYKANSPSRLSDERDLGSEAAFRAHYEKQNQDKEDYRELQSFCHDLATATNIVEFFHKRVDLDEYLNYLAATALVQNWDCFNKNHVLVHDALGSTKWLVVPWDLDRTFGDHWAGGYEHAALPLHLGTSALRGPTGWNRMFERFFSEPTLRKQFLDRLETLLRTEFTKEKLFPLLDQMEADILPDARLDRERWPYSEGNDPQEGIAGVKRYVHERRAYLLREIKAARY